MTERQAIIVEIIRLGGTVRKGVPKSKLIFYLKMLKQERGVKT